MPGRYRALSEFYKMCGPGFAASKSWVDDALRRLSDGGAGAAGGDGTPSVNLTGKGAAEEAEGSSGV